MICNILFICWAIILQTALIYSSFQGLSCFALETLQKHTILNLIWFYLIFLRCTIASILYIRLRLQLLTRCHWSLKRNFMMKLPKKTLLSKDLAPFNFLSMFRFYCYYIFLLFTMKFQIGKKIVSEIWNILYKNYREKLLWFNAFFAKFLKIYTHKLFDFVKFF